MKIIILILFIFYSNHSFAESNFNKKENFDLKDSEFEIAWGGIFKKIPKLIKPRKIPQNGKNFRDLKPKIPDDSWYFPNPSVIGPQIARIKRQYEREYEEITTWNCPSHIENDDSLNEEEKEEKCAAYHLSCNVKVLTKNSIGSGFFINRNTIITNFHVIEKNKADIKIIPFFNNVEIKAKLKTFNETLDIAAITINRGFKNNKDLKICEIKKSTPNLGDVAIAIGHPKGEKDFHISKGKINAFLDISLKPLANNDPLIHWLNINTPIGPGSSGGPLYNKGFIIGVNTSGIPNTNINYAIYFKKLEIFLETNNISQGHRFNEGLFKELKINPIQKFNRVIK